MQSFTITPVGTVRTSVKEPLDDVWGGLGSRVELDPSRFSTDSLLGLSDFSHVEVFFFFDRIPESALVYGARHPRNNPAWPKVGIFAARAKSRPSRIGNTVCRLVKVDGLAIEVEGLDAIDGTPVLDIKPYLAGFAPKGEIREPDWSKELMAGYWGKPPAK